MILSFVFDACVHHVLLVDCDIANAPYIRENFSKALFYVQWSITIKIICARLTFLLLFSSAHFQIVSTDTKKLCANSSYAVRIFSYHRRKIRNISLR